MKQQLGAGQEDNYTKNKRKTIFFEEMYSEEKNNETEPSVPKPKFILMNKGIPSTWINK